MIQEQRESETSDHFFTFNTEDLFLVLSQKIAFVGFSLCLSHIDILEGHLKEVGTFHSAVFCVYMLWNRNVEMKQKNEERTEKHLSSDM